MVPTIVQVTKETLQLLNKLEKEGGIRGHDELLRMMINDG